MKRHLLLTCMLSFTFMACGSSSHNGELDEHDDGSAPHGSTPQNDAASASDDAATTTKDASAPEAPDAGGDATVGSDDAGVDGSEDAGKAANNDASASSHDGGIDNSVDGGSPEDASVDSTSPPTDDAASDDGASGSDGAADSASASDGAIDSASELDAGIDSGSGWKDASSATDASAFDASYPTSPTPVAVTYSCTSPLSSSATDISGTFVGAAPVNIPTGVSFDLKNFQLVASLPGSLVSEATGYGETSVSGTATTIDIGSNDTNEATLNGAGKGIAFGPLALVAGEALVLSLPASPETIGSWSATEAGTIDFTAGQVVLDVSFKGSFPISTTLTCVPSGTASVFATTTAL